MHLMKVYSNKDSFKTVKFNETGLSFIVAKAEGDNTKKRGKTYNGVGKTLLVRIVHFCLGASTSNYKDFCEKLPGWEFYLDFKIGEKKFTSQRNTDNSKRMFLNGKEMSLNNFNKELEKMCFDIPDNISYLSFRSLIPFFIRPNRESYVDYFKPIKGPTPYQFLMYNSFLLGLDVHLIQRKKELRDEKKDIQSMKKNFTEDPFLRDFFIGNKDAELRVIDLEEKIKNMEEDLKRFRVAEDYYDVQKEADYIEKELFQLTNEIILLSNHIQNIEESLQIKNDITKKDLLAVYEEANFHFSESVTKRFDQVESFYEKLIKNRKERLLEQKAKLLLQINEMEGDSLKLQKELNSLMQYLGEHQALDLFVSLNNRLAELKTERDNLINYKNLQKKYEDREREIEAAIIDQTQESIDYLNKSNSEMSNLRDYFRNLAKKFYPESTSGLTIKTNDGNNTLRFDIEAKIESDTSDGINNVKIFCYDMTILFKGKNHCINFLLHDSRLFDGIDERQKTDLFEIVYDKFNHSNYQYIATVNQNQLLEIEKHLTEDEFKKIIEENTVLTLTDDSDSEKLLGIRVDIDG